MFILATFEAPLACTSTLMASLVEPVTGGVCTILCEWLAVPVHWIRISIFSPIFSVFFMHAKEIEKKYLVYLSTWNSPCTSFNDHWAAFFHAFVLATPYIKASI